MDGTLAIWFDPTDDRRSTKRRAPTRSWRAKQTKEKPNAQPEIELHFNLWRDMQSTTEPNFLDVGIRFGNSIEQVKQFYLYLPTRIRNTHIENLSEVLKYGQTLDAVFNSVITQEEHGDRYFTTTENGVNFTTVHKIEVGENRDVWVEDIENNDRTTGSRLIFSEDLCRRIKAQQDKGRVNSYIRIRIHLKDIAATLFSQEVEVGNRLSLPLIGQLELTEFRLNEKRSYPERIAELAGDKNFNITMLHYFLIRNLRHQLTMQHEPFRKVRRLEGKLWRHYLIGAASHESVAEYERLANQMVIYHWRKDSNDDHIGIKDFVAFASFRASMPNLILYIIGAIALGAVGSVLAVVAGEAVLGIVGLVEAALSAALRNIPAASSIDLVDPNRQPGVKPTWLYGLDVAFILALLAALWRCWGPLLRAWRRLGDRLRGAK